MFLDSATPIAFAHRGYAPDGAENSMTAFARAVDLGYRYLETDVRVTADGVALAFHDATLERTTDDRGRIDALPWQAVSAARIAGREPIPLLTDLLAAWPQVCINLDVKADRGVGPTIDAIRYTNAVERVCIGAFSSRRIADVQRALGPRLCTSLGPQAALRLRLSAGRLAPLGPTRRRVTARCAQVPARIGRRPFVDARYLAAAHALGLQVHAWTVNDPAEMARLLDLGVDGIMTDDAPALRDQLVARGAWPPRRPTRSAG
jgi:glycerophosphoryl diester phosphodiesterase